MNHLFILKVIPRTHANGRTTPLSLSWSWNDPHGESKWESPGNPGHTIVGQKVEVKSTIKER